MCNELENNESKKKVIWDHFANIYLIIAFNKLLFVFLHPSDKPPRNDQNFLKPFSCNVTKDT